MLTRLALFATLALLLAAGPADALIVYDSFGPGWNYDAAQGRSIGGSSDQSVAQPFVPSASGSLLSLYFQVGWSVGANHIVVSLHADAGGEPGSVLESYSLVNQMIAFTDPWTLPYELVSTTGTFLTAGTTYWVSVSTPDPAAALGWHFSLPGVMGTIAVKNDGLGQIDWTVQGPTPISALAVDVRPALPEPAAALLWLAAALGLGGHAGRSRPWRPAPRTPRAKC